ncbi:MAG: FAD-dependent oxidoreductase [Thermoleophilia bacterium]
MRLKAHLRERGIEFKAIDVSEDEQAMAAMKERTGKSFVPQVLVGDDYIGSYDEFTLYEARGDLDKALGIETAPRDENRIYDLIIIGGGPAGLTAAVYAARKNLDTLLVAEMLGGQPMETAEVENYMGYQFVTGPELMQRFEEQTRQYRIEIREGERVARVELAGAAKQVLTEAGGSYRGRTLIVATGKRAKLLGIPGEYEYSGRGVSYCATCDGPLFKGHPVMVAGGGNSGLQAALELAPICPEVHLVSLSELQGDEILVDKVRADERITRHIKWQPVEIRGNSSVESVLIESVDGSEQRELAVKGVFVEVGMNANSSCVVDLLDLNPAGEIVVDNEGRTSQPGVFAAGDVTQVRDKQIVVAAGEGAKAALSAHEYLLNSR